MVHGNQFAVNHVPLEEGQNTITASAVDSQGYSASDSIIVNAETTGDYVRITADPETGLSPLETILTIDGTVTITDIDVIDQGPDPVVYQTGSEPYETIAQMTTTGIYYFLALVTDDQNNTYTDWVAVDVLDEAELDALLKAKWNGMKTGLYNADINSALGYIATSAREQYEYSFNLLSPYLAEISAGLHDITMIRISDREAEYNVLGDQGGQTYSFYVLFIKDSDGIWRIRFF